MCKSPRHPVLFFAVRMTARPTILAEPSTCPWHFPGTTTSTTERPRLRYKSMSPSLPAAEKCDGIGGCAAQCSPPERSPSPHTRRPTRSSALPHALNEVGRDRRQRPDVRLDRPPEACPAKARDALRSPRRRRGSRPRPNAGRRRQLGGGRLQPQLHPVAVAVLIQGRLIGRHPLRVPHGPLPDEPARDASVRQRRRVDSHRAVRLVAPAILPAPLRLDLRIQCSDRERPILNVHGRLRACAFWHSGVPSS